MRWFKHQCVAVGWPPEEKNTLEGPGKKKRGFAMASKAITAIEPGDWIVVALSGRKIGRIGQVTGKAIRDDEWDPLVPKDKEWPYGEMGRRIFVRWNLSSAPDDIDLVVQLPEDFRLHGLATVTRIKSRSLAELQSVMSDSSNWVGLRGHFGYEKALSDYIALNPHKLQDGLLPHPSKKIREKVFRDKKRLDVLLVDRDGKPVIVECKQHSPTVAAINQLRHYMRCLREETNSHSVRGILVHGGAKNLVRKVALEAKRKPQVEIVQYKLDIDFSASK